MAEPTRVFGGRMPVSLHRKLKEAARLSGRSLSDEMAWRVGLTFEWERAFNEARSFSGAYRRLAKSLELEVA